MDALSAHDIVELWELGQERHPLDRALLLLSSALPERSPDELFSLGIGERDGLLLTLREKTLGPALPGVAECPACGETLELPLSTGALRVPAGDAAGEYLVPAGADGIEVRFRLPNSLDVAASLQEPDADAARRRMAERCVIEARRGGDAIAAEDLPAGVIERFSARIGECDPQAEILLDLRCPACNHEWQLLFDIVSFFWSEIAAQARRLLVEVHTLARAYGWSESQILGLSPRRRRLYLEMVSG
jgi:hypothetical protein